MICTFPLDLYTDDIYYQAAIGIWT